MKTLTAALIVLAAASCQPVMAEPKFPVDLHLQPEKFCFVAGVISAGIMERLNVGYRPEPMYAEMNRIDQPQLSTYLNETVSLAVQFANHSSEPVPPKEFAKWNYQRCMRTMKTI